MKLIYRCLCVALGAILGSGCSDSTEPVEYGPQPEYGVPTGTIRLDGRVINRLGAPVAGIEVSFAGARPDTTDAAGTWAIDEENASFFCVLNDQEDCLLSARDIDGAANGGPYFAPDMVLDLVRTRPGSGSFDIGVWEQHGIDVVMDEGVEYGPPVAKVRPPQPPSGSQP